MMANERLSVFENTGDVDLSEFTPAADVKKPIPPREKVKAVSEAARFPSREAPAPVPEPPKRKPRYHKTGRTASLSWTRSMTVMTLAPLIGMERQCLNDRPAPPPS